MASVSRGSISMARWKCSAAASSRPVCFDARPMSTCRIAAIGRSARSESAVVIASAASSYRSRSKSVWPIPP